MTSIGFATLQIIPSLDGVSEAIEKQVAGKVVPVKVQAQVDTRAAQKAGKEAGETVTKEVNSAVRKGDIGKTVQDEIKSATKSGGGKEAAKSIVDGLVDGIKSELPKGGLSRTIVDGIAEGVKQGIDGVGIGGQVVTTITTGIKSGNLGGTIKDAIVPAIKGIGDELRTGAASWAGDIANSLRSGDIQGATTEIGDTVRNTTDLIADIGDTFGLQLDGVREFGNTASTTLSSVGGDIQGVINTADQFSTALSGIGSLLETVLPGKASAGVASMTATFAPLITAIAAINAAVAQLPKNLQGVAASTIPGVSPTFRDQGADKPWYERDITSDFWRWLQKQKGNSAGGYTGSMPADMIAGVVHGGEYVINAQSTAGIQNAMPGLLPYLNGYKGGGKVELGNISAPGITTGEQQSMWDAVRGKFPGAILSSATRTVMTEGHPDLHNAGRAIDISGPGMGSIASWIASNFPDSLELIHSPFGRNIKNGKSVGDGMAFYGAGLMKAHENHVHWALGKMANVSTSDTGISAAMPEMTAGDGMSSIGSAISAPAMGGDGGATKVNLAGSFSGLAGTGLDKLNLKTKAATPGAEDLSLNIGNAASAAVGGQVSSLLGGFGINDSPGWLKGIAGAVNAISFNKNAGDSVVPTSAINAGFSAAGSALGSVQSGSGARPGPVTTYNIQTTDIEPAYLASQRLERERAAATLAVY